MIIIIFGYVVYSLNFLNKTRLVIKHIMFIYCSKISIFTVTFFSKFSHEYSDQLIIINLNTNIFMLNVKGALNPHFLNLTINREKIWL